MENNPNEFETKVPFGLRENPNVDKKVHGT
jgi:hypothetical protein